jgi:peptidoglycan/LPS O-acetylase OafA/YrhL
MNIKKNQCYKCNCSLNNKKKVLIFFKSMCLDCFNTQKRGNPFYWLLIDKLSLSFTILLVLIVAFLICAFLGIIFEKLLPPWLALIILLLFLIFLIAGVKNTKKFLKYFKINKKG